MRLAIR